MRCMRPSSSQVKVTVDWSGRVAVAIRSVSFHFQVAVPSALVSLVLRPAPSYVLVVTPSGVALDVSSDPSKVRVVTRPLLSWWRVTLPNGSYSKLADPDGSMTERTWPLSS